MTYQTGSTIEAKDFNLFLTGTEDGSYYDHLVSNLGSLISEGYGKYGYGKVLTLTPKEYGDSVTATDWNTIIAEINRAGLHQGTTVAAMTGTINNISYPVPAIGVKVKALPNIQTNLDNLMGESLNATAQGQSTQYQLTYSSQWKRQVSFTYTIDFESADKARYFFNRGGQIKITPFHPTGGTGDVAKINQLFNYFGTACGSVFLSSPVSNDSASIKGVNYSGLTRIGTSLPTPAVYLTHKGWYSLSSGSEVVFAVLGSNLIQAQRLVGYNSSGIKIEMNTNGVQTLNGDNGSQLVIKVTFFEIADAGKSAIIASAGSRCTLNVIEPSTARYVDTWGLISVTTSMVGS